MPSEIDFDSGLSLLRLSRPHRCRCDASANCVHTGSASFCGSGTRAALTRIGAAREEFAAPNPFQRNAVKKSTFRNSDSEAERGTPKCAFLKCVE
jgi:hypothetical protein